MTSRSVRALADLASPAGGAGGPVQFMTRTVNSVREDGTVNLTSGDGVLLGVHCWEAYTDRTPGDKVIVARWRGGMAVLGRMGGDPADTPADPGLALSWGTASPPGSGWVTGTLYVRDGELYVQTASGASTPPPASIDPSGQGAWRDGSRDTGQDPTQGAWPTYPHPWTGAWFYGSQITTAAAAGTISALKLTLARSASSHGSYSAVTPILYLTAASSPSSTPPSVLGDPWTGFPALGLGSRRTATLPSSWRDALRDGTAKGVVAKAGTGSSYLIFSGSCGQLSVVYS